MNKSIFCILCGLASVAQAGPVELTAQQMDKVTSGKAAVVIRTGAFASGPVTHTYTNAQTIAGGFESGGTKVEYGFGVGFAVACCGANTGTSVNAGATGQGDVTHTNTRTRSFSNRFFSTSSGTGSVVAITRKRR